MMWSMDFSAGALLASLIVSSIGAGLLVYGKKALRLPHFLCGLALSIYPFFVTGAGWILGIGAVLLVGLWSAVRAGM
jgi:hypothetical protein